MKNLLNILNQFIEDVEDNDPDKNLIKDIINSVTIEIYPNGIPEKNDEKNIKDEIIKENNEKINEKE